MIISVEELLVYPEFRNTDYDLLITKLKAVETMVRKFTNNNFQNRNIRFRASSADDRLNGSSAYLQAGDTIQISESGVNDGLYRVTGVYDDYITVDSELFAVGSNLVTKVEYPADIKIGVVNLMKWETTNRDKVGVKSETISRHSVTYYDQDSTNQVMGYPVSLLGFLRPYMKARF